MTTDLEARLAALEQQNAALTAALAERDVNGPDDSLEIALREFRKEHENSEAFNQSLMAKPCQITVDGALCGRPWDDHLSPRDGVRPLVTGHQYRPTPFQAGPSVGHYPRDPVTEMLAAKADPVALLMTPVQARSTLECTAAQLNALVKQGSVRAVKIGSVTLIDRASVERIVAAIAMEAAG